ncbi:MAG: hypothetical protein IPK83_17280 [Planctomycetes bacterium]|nr:hypothetical protein [Planctomycetota bacterium]
MKRCRHELVEAVSCFDARDLLMARDVTGDVGTQIRTPQEQTRINTEAVAIAAAKRAGESLRVIEEYGKTVDASVAAGIELLRYEVYSIEQEIILPGPRPKSIRKAQLHVLLTQSACKELAGRRRSGAARRSGCHPIAGEATDGYRVAR